MSLPNSHCLGDFHDFILNFWDTSDVAIDVFNGICKFGRCSIFTKNIDEQHVVGHVVCFDQVNKAYIQGKFVIVSGIEQGF